MKLNEDLWWVMRGLNLRPPACKAGALPAELITHKSVQSQYFHAATELYEKPSFMQSGKVARTWI